MKIKMLKTKTLNKAVSTLLMLLLTLSTLSAISMMLPVYASVSITNMSPTSGPVGTSVTFNGTITTYAGPYTIYFDSDAGGIGETDEVVTSGNAVGTIVDTTFTVPDSTNGTRRVILQDTTANSNATGIFTVGTTYGINVVQTHGQESYTNITITANVTGGTQADIPIQINVTKPDGSSYLANETLVTDNDWGNATKTISSQTAITFEQLCTNVTSGVYQSPTNCSWLNFTYAPVLDGSQTVWANVTGSANATLTHGTSLNTANYTCRYNETNGFVGIRVNCTNLNCGANTTVWANYTYLNFTTPYCGTYTASLNVSSVTDTFQIILTNATEYNRGNVVDLRSTGWNFTTAQRLNFTITGSMANTTAIWVNSSAPYRTANYTWTVPSDATLGTYTVTVTNMTAGLNKTALTPSVPDTSTFQVTGAGVLSFTNETYPNSQYMRTQTALWNFNVTYPSGANFTSTNASLTPAYVYYNNTQTATATVSYRSGGSWNATWAIPKDQTLGSGYKFVISANSWNDTYNNQGPTAGLNSTTFTILLANLTITWYNATMAHYNATLTPKAWQNRTLWQNCTFRITYPDSTPLTASLTASLNITVWNGTTTVANLSYATGEATFSVTTNNWTARWDIPYNTWNATYTSTSNSTYTFCILANKTVDTHGNKGPMTGQANSTTFSVTPAALTVVSISTTESSYARGTTLTVYFTAEYPGSPVTTGNATIILVQPDASTATIYATYSAGNSRFQATYYLDFSAQLGTWTVNLTANALNDTKGVSARWYPGNTGPTAFRTTTFTVTESSLLLQINSTVTDLEAKLDNVDWGLEAIKNLITQLQTSLNAVGTKVDSIYTEVTSSTYGLSALKTLLDAVKAKTDTINWDDITAIGNEVTAIEAKLDNSTYGLVAIKNLITQLQTSLNAVGTKVDSIYTEVTHVSTRKFDFGTETSLWEPGFIQATPSTSYTASQGYGWTNTTSLYARDRGAPDYTRRDLVFSADEKTFQVDLTNGDYTVIVTLGDQSYGHDNMNITVEGSSATVSSVAGTFVQKVFHVTVADGSLTVTMKDDGGADTHWVINTLIIEQSWK